MDVPAAPDMATPEVFPAEPPLELPTAETIAAIHQQAYDEGFSLGRKEGRQQAYKEGRAASEGRIQQLEQLLELLSHPLKIMDEEVEHALVDLVGLIARHMVRRELKTSPGEIVAVVKEAMSLLPVGSRHPRIHLHPDDLELVKEALGLGEQERSWRLEADPLISRGGCKVETATSYIDATVEARLHAIIAKMLGGAREGDRGP